MPSRFRGSFFAALLVCFAAPAFSEHPGLAEPGQQQPPPAGANYQTADQRPIEPSVGGRAVPPDNATGQEHDPGSPAQGEEQSGKDGNLILGDGWAQWVMAVTSGLGLIVSGWAVWLVKGTLDETRRAVRAAEQANQVSREIGEAQVRAYVDIVKVRVKGLEVGSVPEVTFYLVNTGVTPAHKMRPIVSLKVGYGKHFFNRKNLAVLTKTLTAGDRVKMKVHWVDPITEDEMRNITSGEWGFFFLAYISYFDVFGKFRRSICRTVAKRNHITGGEWRFIATRRNNRSS